MRSLFAAMSSLLVASCASTGEFKADAAASLQPSQLAHVVAAVEKDVSKNFLAGLYVQTRITCVDGTNTSSFFGYGGGGGFAPEVALTPGRHYVSVEFTGGQWRGGSTMWLDALAGHTYDAKFEQQGSGFRMWLVDRDGGKVVGGLPGGEPDGISTVKSCS